MVHAEKEITMKYLIVWNAGWWGMCGVWAFHNAYLKILCGIISLSIYTIALVTSREE